MLPVSTLGFQKYLLKSRNKGVEIFAQVWLFLYESNVCCKYVLRGRSAEQPTRRVANFTIGNNGKASFKLQKENVIP